MKKYMPLALGCFAMAMFLPGCASHQTANTTRASNAKKDSRYVTSVGRRNIPVYENRGSHRIPDE